jgi:alkaline phosphatase D
MLVVRRLRQRAERVVCLARGVAGSTTRAVVAAIVAAGCTAPSTPPPPAGTSYPGCPFVDPAHCVAPTPGPAGPRLTIAPAPTRSIDGSMLFATVSCLRHTPGGAALADIAALDPDVVLWLGDNIYADTDDPLRMRALYDELGANPRFEALSETAETMAVWDDHDYGSNNANRTWPHRDAAKAEFDRFWDVPDGDPRRSQPGVYSARTFGTGDRTVQVILLDVRYNLDPYDYDGAEPSRTILGAEQWAWLAERLAEPATIRLIGSGIQVVNDYDIDPQPEWEGWDDSPLERQRLFDLIRGMGVPGVIFVSGDMHFAELTRHPDATRALGYPTYDLTPSGMDQSASRSASEWRNPDRIGDPLNSHRKFGTIEVDWTLPDPEVHLRIHDGGRVHLEQVIRLSELQPS